MTQKSEVFSNECKLHSAAKIRTQWPRHLRSGSAAACLLGLRVRILQQTMLSVSCERSNRFIYFSHEDVAIQNPISRKYKLPPNLTDDNINISRKYKLLTYQMIILLFYVSINFS